MTISSYNMWLSFDGGKELFQIPVNPEKIDVNNGSSNQSINITDLGEITIIQGRKQIQFSFSSFFPKTKFNGISVYELLSPNDYVEKIERWKASKKPIQIVITGANIDIYCTIESFNYYHIGGDIGTIYYSISLKEYREVSIRKVNTDVANKVATVSENTRRVDNTIKPSTYTVVKGDCLWNISHKFLGNGNRYKEIMTVNTLKNTTIYPNQVLKLPT